IGADKALLYLMFKDAVFNERRCEDGGQNDKSYRQDAKKDFLWSYLLCGFSVSHTASMTFIVLPY
ncbi:MAG: hypothetical protein IKW90_01715, partial [Lachnospiraceae bacterium]|nr:hypothetical protein [Lachnospiraceae bacterium]